MEKTNQTTITIENVVYERSTLVIDNAKDVNLLLDEKLADKKFIIIKMGQGLNFSITTDLIKYIIGSESFTSIIGIELNEALPHENNIIKEDIMALNEFLMYEKVIGISTCNINFLLNFDIKILKTCLWFKTDFTTTENNTFKQNIRIVDIIMNISSKCFFRVNTKFSSDILLAFNKRISQNQFPELNIKCVDDGIYLLISRKYLGICSSLSFVGVCNLMLRKYFNNIVNFRILLQTNMNKKKQKAIFRIFNNSKKIKKIIFYEPKNINLFKNGDFKNLTTFLCSLREVKKGNIKKKCSIWIKRCLLNIESNLLLREITKKNNPTYKLSFGYWDYSIINQSSLYLKVMLSSDIVSQKLSKQVLRETYESLQH